MLVELRHLLENGLSDEKIKDYFSNFKCKKDKDIDKFLTEYALSYEKNGVSRTTLVLDDNCSHMFISLLEIPPRKS